MAHYIRKAHLYYDRRFDLFFADNLLCCNYSEIEDMYAPSEPHGEEEEGFF